MKPKKLLVYLCLTFFSAGMRGQSLVIPGTVYDEPSEQPKDRPVNFGIKGGFTSSLFLVSGFSIDGTVIDEVQNNYKIGYFGSFFMRINFGRHFLQPEVSYNINRCNIAFARPLPTGSPATPRTVEAAISSSIHSIDLPVIYGYNIVKEGPYNLAVFGGPKIRYIRDKKSDITFKNFDGRNIREQLHPFNLSFTTGVSVTISRVFFDFRYDIGLHNISKRVTCNRPAGGQPTEQEIRFRRRDNVLSFSFGVLF